MKSLKFARKRMETADLASDSDTSTATKSLVDEIEKVVKETAKPNPFDEILKLVEYLNKHQEVNSSAPTTSSSSSSTSMGSSRSEVSAAKRVKGSDLAVVGERLEEEGKSRTSGQAESRNEQPRTSGLVELKNDQNGDDDDDGSAEKEGENGEKETKEDDEKEEDEEEDQPLTNEEKKILARIKKLDTFCIVSFFLIV